MTSNSFNKDILKEKIGLAGCGNMGLPMLNSMVLKNIDVKGYDIETVVPTYLDAPKPRTTKLVENQALEFNTGATVYTSAPVAVPVVASVNV